MTMSLYRTHKFATYFLAAVAFACLLAAFCSSCGMLPVSEPEKVLADPQYVAPQAPVIPTLLPVRDQTGEDTGRDYVIVSELDLPEEAPRVHIERAPQGTIAEPGVVEAIGGMLGGTPLGPFAPLVGYVLTKLVASPRSRREAMKAAKSALTLDLRSAAASLAKAEGWAHSRPEPSQPSNGA